MILVDYRCDNCLGTSEHLVSNPVPATVSCPACLSSARRRFAPVGLSGRASAPVDQPVQSNRALCRDNPDVPGLCHMNPSSAVGQATSRSGEDCFPASRKYPPP